MKAHPTIIITGASQGIGAGLVSRFLDRGYNVVATSRNVSASKALPESERLLRVDGDVADPAAAAGVVDAAMITKGGIEAGSRNLAMEFAGERIRVNTVAPGIVDTPMHADDPKEEANPGDFGPVMLRKAPLLGEIHPEFPETGIAHGLTLAIRPMGLNLRAPIIVSSSASISRACSR